MSPHSFSLLFEGPVIMAFDSSARAHPRGAVRLKERIHRERVLRCLAHSRC